MKTTTDIATRFAPYIEQLPNTLVGTLGIEFLELHKERVVASMPVDNRTKQPMGILHGGASVALAESIASVGARLNVDNPKAKVVGLEINANHIKAMTEGEVIGTATPLHLGRSTQVWQIRIEAAEGALVCLSRCTMAVLNG